MWCHESSSSRAILKRWHWLQGTAVSQQLRVGHLLTKACRKPAAPYIWAVKKQTKKSNNSNQKNTNKNSIKFLPLKPQESFTATLPSNASIIQKFSYSTNSNKLITCSKSKNTERMSHKVYKIAHIFTKYVLEIIVKYLLLLFTFAKTKTNKSLIADSVTVTKKVFSFCF